VNTADITKHGPRDWSRTGRPVRPYVVDPITITVPSLTEQPPPPNADPTDGRRFLLDPIHPHLFALTPGDPDTFTAFATRFGLEEFFDWIGLKGFPVGHPITDVMERYDSGYRHFPLDTLTQAWTEPRVAQAVEDEQTLLREAFLEAEHHDARDAARIVLSHGWGHGAFLIDLALDEADGVVYEHPRHIWSRGWFELFEGVSDNKLPNPCHYCGELFIPSRSNAAYCTGTNCQQRAYDRRRAKTEKRKNYQKEYKRKERSQKRVERETGPGTKGENDGVD
jgi:hypothetical protein